VSSVHSSSNNIIMSFLNILVVAHAVFMQSMGQECCGSKTVGDYSYTITETTDNVPQECKDSCTYTRDDNPGSIYCFKDGLLPAKCTGETPLDVCSPGGCPPESDTRVVDIEPTTISERPTLDDCWDFCVQLCKEAPWCPCHAWNYNLSSGECFTYPYRKCYLTKKEPGWTFGKLCLDSHTPQGEYLASKDVPGEVKFTIGNLFGAHIPFSDQPIATTGNITQIIIYTGNYNGRNNVVVGVRFSYGGSQAQLHGRVSDVMETCDFPIQDGIYVRDIQATALNDGGSQGGQFSMIYSLTVVTNEGSSACFAGNTQAGQTFSFSGEGYPLNYIYGRTTQPQPQMLGSLTFVFYNEETCPQCCPDCGDSTATL